jgi:cytochrome P450
MVFDYETVKWIMTDHASFSSRIPAPNFSFIFTDQPQHTRLRNLISRAFTPGAIADLEPAIREISKELFDSTIAAGQMEFAADFSAPLAMRVIAGMIGIRRLAPLQAMERQNPWPDFHPEWRRPGATGDARFQQRNKRDECLPGREGQ